jgi:hypothetical protein
MTSSVGRPDLESFYEIGPFPDLDAVDDKRPVVAPREGAHR